MSFLTKLFFIPTRKKDILLRIIILAAIYLLAFSVRLFSVLRFESVIHEFDPYFNYRSTIYLVEKGFYEFFNWFDHESWYPLGRIVGGTVYPGLMITAAIVYWTLNAINITINIRNVCVLLAPFFAGNTTIAAYLLTSEIRGPSAGLLAAALICIVPGYISRSVAGSYDYECISIFILLMVFYYFIKSINGGSFYDALLACLFYFYMVNSWGGYIFIINIIPVYVLTLLVTGRYSHRLYMTYSMFYTLGTLLSMQVRFVGFQAVQNSDHMGALGVFLILQVYCFIQWARSYIDEKSFATLFSFIITTVIGMGLAAYIVASATGYIAPFSGRFMVLLDPTYAKKHIPIIASVSEHQPTTWASFFFDLHILTLFLPVGLYFCFRDMTDASIFIILYGVLSVYFAGVMVRLMLILAPAAVILSAIGISQVLKAYMRAINDRQREAKLSPSHQAKLPPRLSYPLALIMVFGITFILMFYSMHCIWVTSEAYSSPSIVLAARGNDGGRIIFDDFREAYYWLSQNTPVDSKIMSWWDYGYQITAMANRTIIVDNNTWNNSHIATVGKAMASNEEESYKIMKRLDVDYALVIFGGVTGYSSDDINKFLWMVRIGSSVYPEIREGDYLTSRGDYRIDKEGTPTMLNSLMYKMSYYRFGEMMTQYGMPTGYDRVRGVEIGRKGFTLEHIEEAYSTEHFLVRIYKVKKENNRS
jgi:dolichyl-diphosphooligosaccharide--protein glycosyltransferase